MILIAGLCAARALAADSATVITLTPVPGGVDVTIGGRPFTTYRYANPDGTPIRRPYLHPVLADDSKPVTSDQFTVHAGDHPHHRSIWTGHGDVNGEDHWATNDWQAVAPRQLPLADPVIDGPALVHRLSWDCGEDCLLTEERRLEFAGRPDGTRMIDVTSRFGGGGHGDETIRLGDTKEAGLVAIRAAPFISASAVITSSTGGQGEPACWGRAAEWCDLSGPAPSPTHGIAVISHPANPRYPPRWHVRAYGLLAANPFGLSAFDKVPAGTGEFRFDAAAGVTFRHLVVVHRGPADPSRLAELSAAFAGGWYDGQMPPPAGRAFWRFPSPNPWWTVRDGVLTGAQDPGLKGSILESRDAFRDLIVDLEYRYTGDVDSGIFLRADRGYQCQIGISRSLKRDMTASIYDAKRMYVAEAKPAPALNRAGEWNRLRIEARGDRFRHWLNGILVLDYTDPAFAGAGPVGLQLHPGVRDMRIEFRNIRVLRLDPAAPL